MSRVTYCQHCLLVLLNEFGVFYVKLHHKVSQVDTGQLLWSYDVAMSLFILKQAIASTTAKDLIISRY